MRRPIRTPEACFCDQWRGKRLDRQSGRGATNQEGEVSMPCNARWLVSCALALGCVSGCARASDEQPLERRSSALSTDDALPPDTPSETPPGQAVPAEDAPVDVVPAVTDVVPPVTVEPVCVRQPPILRVSPDTATVPSGSLQVFDLELANASDASCPSDVFFVLGASIPDGLSVSPGFEVMSLAPGESAHLALTASVSELAQPGTLTFQYLAVSSANFDLQTTAEASVVATPAEPLLRSGCPETPNQPLAPGGYYVNGNTICTAAGRAHLFHGVDRPSLEWLSTGDNLSSGDFELMRSWNANVVRIALNQDFWLPGSALSDPDYPSRVEDAVAWAEAAGLDVILDLHWSDAGVLGGCLPEQGCQQLMPDVNSLAFWREVATRFGADGRVQFELYNEPHQVSFELWKNGGLTQEGWQAVGMQTLYDAIRATGAENLVIVGGLDWAYDLSVVASQRITGHNIAYATHPYSDPANPGRPPEDWSRAWGWLTRTDPVIVTEFGSLFDPTCSTDYGAQVVQYADAHFASWTAWAWYPGGCEFPALIEDWQGTPSPSGAIVQTALLGYDDPPAALAP
jgi:endoglucanase